MRSGLALISLSILLSGCFLDDPVRGRRDTDPPADVIRVNRLEDSEGVCPCTAVDKTTARLEFENLDKTHNARGFYVVTTSDQGGVINTSEPIQIDPDLGPGQHRAKGCTISPDRTVAQNEPRSELERICRIRTQMRIVSSVVLDRPTSRTKAALVDKNLVVSAEHCRKQCTDGAEGICLDLGRRHSTLAAPFLTMLDAARSANRKVIPIGEAYRAAGIDPATDTCKRGDIVIGSDKVFNAGAASCAIDRSSIAMLMSDRASEAQKFAALTGPFDTRLEIPKELVMTRQPGLSPAREFTGSFEDSAKSFYLAFREAPLNKSLALDVPGLNDKFGGYVRDASYARLDTGRRILVLSTPRGCVSMDAPQ